MRVAQNIKVIKLVVTLLVVSDKSYPIIRNTNPTTPKIRFAFGADSVLSFDENI